jgi:cytochrome b subunit of formate dehydrogenase
VTGFHGILLCELIVSSRLEKYNRNLWNSTGQLFTSKFLISVVELTQIHLATEEDIRAHRDLWASFFKATTWEELNMLAQQDTNIKKAITTVHRLCMDEEFRQQYEAREDRIRQQRDHDYWYDTEIKKRE